MCLIGLLGLSREGRPGHPSSITIVVTNKSEHDQRIYEQLSSTFDVRDIGVARAGQTTSLSSAFDWNITFRSGEPPPGKSFMFPSPGSSILFVKVADASPSFTDAKIRLTITRDGLLQVIR